MNNIHNQIIPEEEIIKIINNHTPENLHINRINDINIFIKAFIHKSFYIKDEIIDDEDNYCVFSKDSIKKQGLSNERLEFLGDAFLNLATAEYLFDRFKDKDEGFLTKLRTKLVRNTQLSHIGSNLGFNKWILISSHVERISGRENARLIEDVFESFLASIYKDQGHELCKAFVFGCFDRYVDMNYLIQNNDNYKDMLLRYFQTQGWKFPVYKSIYHTGDVYNGLFTTVVLVNKSFVEKDVEIFNNQNQIKNEVKNESEEGYNILIELMKKNYIITIAKGKTKKISEQECSKLALNLLKVPKDF